MITIILISLGLVALAIVAIPTFGIFMAPKAGTTGSSAGNTINDTHAPSSWQNVQAMIDASEAPTKHTLTDDLSETTEWGNIKNPMYVRYIHDDDMLDDN